MVFHSYHHSSSFSDISALIADLEEQQRCTRVCRRRFGLTQSCLAASVYQFALAFEVSVLLSVIQFLLRIGCLAPPTELSGQINPRPRPSPHKCVHTFTLSASEKMPVGLEKNPVCHSCVENH